MKTKLLLAVALLFFPLTATAGLIGTSSMTMEANTASGYESVNFPAPNSSSGNYYVDYEIKVKPTLPVDVTSIEAFCLENIPMAAFSTTYDFFTSDTLTTTTYTFEAVTWLADYGTKNVTEKNRAQLAIWQVVLGATFNTSNTSNVANLLSTYNSATDKNAYVNDWLVAVSPPSAGGTNYQNYLVKAPIPEPATMLLFGAGLAGLAGVARRRNKRS